jgi:hypothetical protein
MFEHKALNIFGLKEATENYLHNGRKGADGRVQ